MSRRISFSDGQDQQGIEYRGIELRVQRYVRELQALCRLSHIAPVSNTNHSIQLLHKGSRILILAFILWVGLCGSSSGRVSAQSGKQTYRYSSKEVFNIEEKLVDTTTVVRLNSSTNCYAYFPENPSGERAVFSFSENSFTTINDIVGYVGERRLSKSSIVAEIPRAHDELISDSRRWVLVAPTTIKKGDTLEFSYTTAYKTAEYAPLLIIPNYDYIDSYEVEFHFPKGYSVEFEPFFPGAAIPFKVSGDETSALLRIENLRSTPTREYFDFNGVQACFRLRIRNGQNEVTPCSPEHFGRWYSAMLPKVKDSLSLPSNVATALKSAGSQRDKLRVLYDYIRTDIRYLGDERGVSAIVPRSPSFVLNKHFGDCKDKAYCLQNLARQSGINARMALVCTDHTFRFKGTHISLYNHAICMADIDGERIWMDPTAEQCEFGNLPVYEFLKPSLIIGNGTAELVEAIPPARRSRDMDVSIEADPEKPLDAKATIVLRNEKLWAVRQELNMSSRASIGVHIANTCAREFYGLGFDSLTVTSVGENEARCTARCDISRLLTKTPSSCYVPVRALRAVDGDLLMRERDSVGLYIDDQSSVQCDIVLRGSYQPVAQQIEIGSAAEGLHFTASVRGIGETETLCSYRVEPTLDFVDSTRQAAYLRLCRSYLSKCSSLFTLRRK